MKIGIINAMHKEHEQTASLLQGKKETREGRLIFTEGTIGTNTIILMESGIGKVNAAAKAVELIRRFRPDCLLSTGVAGGIDPSVQVMEVVAAERVAYHDVDCGPETAVGQVQGLPLFYEADSALYRHALNLSVCPPVHGGLLCSGDQFVTAPAQLAAIKEKFPEGLAVDMESGAIAQVCHLYGIPFLSFRIISDTPGADHHFDQYLNFWETLADRSFGVIKTFLEALNDSLLFQSHPDSPQKGELKAIPSFTIDHLRLLRGIYVSRKDRAGDETVTTFDIRMKEPNREPAMGQGALHTIEHLAATYLRNHPAWSDRILYWGPMGCLTGNYLLVRGDMEPEDIAELMRETFRFIAGFEGDVPGAAPQDCGNYLLHDLPMAKWEARKYLHEVLERLTEENLRYPASPKEEH